MVTKATLMLSVIMATVVSCRALKATAPRWQVTPLLGKMCLSHCSYNAEASTKSRNNASASPWVGTFGICTIAPSIIRAMMVPKPTAASLYLC